MRYVTALLSALFWWCATVFVMGVLIGQAFEGIEGLWVIVPIVGTWGTSLGVAGIAFQNSLRRSRDQMFRQRSQAGRCLLCGYDLRASKERCPECGTSIAIFKEGGGDGARK